MPNLESLAIEECMVDEEEEDSDDAEAENNHINHEEVVSNAAKCDNNDQGEASYDKDDDSWALDIATKERLFPHLKSVCFEQFGGNPRELRWVKLILRYAKALQMMTTCYADCDFRFVNVKSEKELKAEIPNFPRASPDCVIDVCCWDLNAFLSR
ncbi:hypothetical protein MKW92_015727 [Papaver armeniacum]|nr:hypothetical protein MKW92_015727 [Papaver armeniacum]